ncbi:mitochondrial carrier domain-containing protein [Mycena pura]|uniref:Mitochondrial carrier domain-containing protein n=1 Tax=Mycena pura TaxID=153505 RepID=A0AAD6VW52_9AGAR|nr:mitochondrial carrier domain-containing protein [Mycena pura]
MASAEKKPLPFVANFAAGAIAGISEILTFYPLGPPPVQVKTRMQLDTGKTSPGLVGSFRSIVREEGCGPCLVPPLLLEAPKRAVKLHVAANDFWGKTFMAYSGESKMTQNLSIITGCTAGATESFVVVPFELVKIKLQDKTSTFPGPMAVLRHIVRNDGLLGLYAGMESTFWRHVWWNGGYFGCIFQVRAMLPRADTPQATLFNNFLAGMVGGFAGTLLNTPCVVKSRIQSAPRVPGVVPKYNWTYPSLAIIFREEGARALYKGFVPKVLRLAPGGGVLLLVVEGVLGMFRQALGPPYI